jgi:hypothetical protein
MPGNVGKAPDDVHAWGAYFDLRRISLHFFAKRRVSPRVSGFPLNDARLVFISNEITPVVSEVSPKHCTPYVVPFAPFSKNILSLSRIRP